MIVAILRILGLVFFALAGLLFLIEIVILFSDARLTTPLGQVWFTSHPPSLNLTQAIVQRYLLPGLWDVILVPLLRMAAWKSLTAVGLLLIVGGILLRNTQDRKRFFHR